MRRFDACALCLNGAREPLACNEGHLFCKECVYTDLCEFSDQVAFMSSTMIMASNTEERHQEAEG
jgi:hypothetical protein